jgi:hypothetical protein
MRLRQRFFVSEYVLAAAANQGVEGVRGARRIVSKSLHHIVLATITSLQN